MTIKKFITSAVFLSLALASSVSAFTPASGSPMSLKQHPRLLITPNSIPALRSAISTSYKAEFQSYINWLATADSDTANAKPADETINLFDHDPFKPVMVQRAFIGALGAVPGINYPIAPSEYSRLAKEKFLKSLKAGDDLGFPAALLYDWTYNSMTAAERSEAVSLMLNRPMAQQKDEADETIANPWSYHHGYVYGTSFFQRGYAWYQALAIWGDGLADAQADKAVDSFNTVMLNYGPLDALNFIAGNDGGVSEWSGYAVWHPLTLWVLMDAWSTATGKNLITDPSVGQICGDGARYHGDFLQYVSDPP